MYDTACSTLSGSAKPMNTVAGPDPELVRAAYDLKTAYAVASDIGDIVSSFVDRSLGANPPCDQACAPAEAFNPGVTGDILRIIRDLTDRLNAIRDTAHRLNRIA